MSGQTSNFTIAAAQSAAIPGDLDENVRRHAAFIRAAREHQVSVVVFPELSLTGYEPTLAAEVAIDSYDAALRSLQELSDRLDITIVAGCPIRSSEDKPYLGALVFRAGQPLVDYRKRFLDSDEEPSFFIPGDRTVVCESHGQRIGIAICADIHNPRHPADAMAESATVYAAGVAMTPSGIAAAESRMSAYAKQYGVPAVMANYAATTGGYDIAGRSAIWNECGEIVAQAESDGEMLVIARDTPGGWTGCVERIQ